MNNNYEALIEKLMQHFTAKPFAKETKVAKCDFTEWAGHFDEKSDGFEVKMTQFSDWYLFVRPLAPFGQAPIQLNLKESGFKVPSGWEESYQNLVSSLHSLFEFLKLKGRDLYIKDVFSGYRITMKDSPVIHGFNKGEIFEARLIPHEGSFVFSNSFCFHPPPSAKYILKEVRKVKKVEPSQLEAAREALIHKLFRMYYRFEHYRHVALKEIYTDKPEPT